MEGSVSASSMQDPSSSPLEKHQSSADRNGDLDSEEGSSLEETGFNWGEYLEETGASAAPHTSFKHVEISIQSNFQPGMKLEVANKKNPDTYWVATVITTCGQLLLLRYCGYGEDRRADFWCDVVIADLHPVGWCTQNNKTLMPPDAKPRHAFDETLPIAGRSVVGILVLPLSTVSEMKKHRERTHTYGKPLRGKGPIDLITVDSLIELQDSQDPFQFWIVSVLENAGGRLRLRYVGLEDTESYDQWLFYLDYRLRPVGWCQENEYRMDPPSEIYPLKTDSEWKRALEKSLIDAAKFPLPMEVFKDHADLRSHFFTVGMKLETVNMSHICPASVTKVSIPPLLLTSTSGVDHITSFSRGFTKNMKLEAVNPRNPGELCVASVIAVKGRLMWLRLEGESMSFPSPPSCESCELLLPDLSGASICRKILMALGSAFRTVSPLPTQSRSDSPSSCVFVVNTCSHLLSRLPTGLQSPAPEFIVDVESMDIFPVGWCEANSYPLTTPHKTASQKKRKIAVVQPEKQSPSTVPVEKIPHDLCLFPHLDATGTVNGKYCCPQLFINHRCFSGPYLNKGRIAELPQSVGPGKCVLVLKEILSMLINAAYKPGRVLRELQLVEDPHWNFQEETLKAKYRGKTYRAVAKIVRTSDQVADFCRRVCAKLECCPNLFSPVLVSENCPENCSIHTKTKYTYYYGKRRKISKPPIGESRVESGHPKPARRRKRRKSMFVQKKRRSSAVDLAAGSGEESEEEDADAMDDDSGSEETGSEIRDDQTDTSSAEVPSTRPRRAVTLRSSVEAERRAPVERSRRARRAPATPQAEGAPRSPATSQEAAEDVKQEEEERLVLESNPLEWSVTDVVRFIKLTDCAPLAKIFQEQDIDGQALLLLTLPTVQECMELKLGPAIKLCHQIERVKVAFYAQYAN
ncbi:hypothetical protein CapIbe_011198 [Capra ibex]